MMGNTILCHACYAGTCALPLLAVGHGAVETALKEIREEWMKARKELDKQSNQSGGGREGWRICACG